MDTNELFYLAYAHYKKELEGNRDIHLFRKGVNARSYPGDYLTMIAVECKIKEDWIEAIEKGLHYIAKCIKEDRQFIRNEGEVLPIEKIRRVSKDSIIDLSKHSNYITRLPEEGEENVVPEKLLMIKRENDYSIYENRVVYTTLSYLKDFVATRLDKIKEATNRYHGTVQIKKKIELGYRTVDVNLNLDDIRNDDPIALESNGVAETIKRIDLILNSVLVLLRTPLMQEVSKAPMVSRPITKTNVLKMNTNFKEALYVFDYVCAYDGLGFELVETEKKIAPLTPEQEDCFTDIVLLSSFFGYQFNNHVEEKFHKGYVKEEKRRKAVIDDETLKRIKETLGRLPKDSKELAEHVQALEEGHKILEERVEEAKTEAKHLIDEYEKRLEKQRKAHEEEIEKLNEYHDELIAKLQDEQLIALAELDEKLRAEYESKLFAEKESLRAQYESTLVSQKTELEQKTADLQRLVEETELLKAKLASIEREHAKEREEIQQDIDYARVVSLTGRYSEDKKSIDLKGFASRASFDELERQKAILDELFEKAWKEAKKEIKKAHSVVDKKKKGDKR